MVSHGRSNKMNLLLLMSLVSYKSTVGRLKALRTEIEHLQLLLERAKVKFQKDFHKWWSQEASSDQVTDSTFLRVFICVTTPHKAEMTLTAMLACQRYVSDIRQEDLSLHFMT